MTKLAAYWYGEPPEQSEPVSGIEPLTCRLQDGRSAY
jgi:hypothetical protein